MDCCLPSPIQSYQCKASATALADHGLLPTFSAIQSYQRKASCKLCRRLDNELHPSISICVYTKLQLHICKYLCRKIWSYICKLVHTGWRSTCSIKTCECLSGTDLLTQFYVLPHWNRSCRSNFRSQPVTLYWHRASQSQRWPYNARRLAG